MNEKSIISQLKERRVIRATLIYVALLWVALQVANVLEEAGFIGEQLVRWLIILGAAGVPVTIFASWFLETPWKQRKWIAVAGDLAIIIAVTVAVALFVWQQWFASFTRPTIAVLNIEATDTRAETEDLAAHLALRLRMTLAMRPELRVIELASSLHSQLDGNPVDVKAGALNADFLIAGTVAQSNSEVRLNLQLYSNAGELLHGETYEDRLLDLARLQNRAVTDLWAQLPLPDDGQAATGRMIANCEYADNRDALLAIAAVDNNKTVDLGQYLESSEDSGMLQLANARILFRELARAENVRKPVLQPIAMQALAEVDELCPGMPDPGFMRQLHTRETVSDAVLREYPNSAVLFRRASNENSEPARAEAFLDEARRLDPLGSW